MRPNRISITISYPEPPGEKYYYVNFSPTPKG